MPRVAIHEIVRRRKAGETFCDAAHAGAVNFVGIDERDPSAGAEFFVDAQTNISGGGKPAERRAIDD